MWVLNSPFTISCEAPPDTDRLRLAAPCTNWVLSDTVSMILIFGLLMLLTSPAVPAGAAQPVGKTGCAECLTYRTVTDPFDTAEMSSSP